MSGNIEEAEPFLGSHPDEEETGIAAVEDPPTPASKYYKRPLKVLTILDIVFASVIILLIIATIIVIFSANYYRQPREAEQALVAIGLWCIPIIILAALNLRFSLPIFLNILADLVLTFVLVAFVAEFFSNWVYYGSDWCSRGRDRYPPGYPQEPISPNCRKWYVAGAILSMTTVAFAAVPATLHFVMLILRITAAVKARSWTQPFGFTFPTGEITLAFTVKVLRQQKNTATADQAPTVAISTD